MSTFKKCKVVMLPTNEKSNIVMNNIQQGLFVVGGDGILAKHRMGDCTNQHLYFLSDVEIKEGDWCYRDTGIIYQMTKELSEYYKSIEGTDIHKSYKIIATTDKSLIIPYDGKTPISENWEGYKLPQPSDSFIQKYVSEYNNGNVITEVLVEYEDKVAMDGHTIIGSELKISKDNTITIRKVKDSWNRDEVIEFAKRYARRCQAPMTDNKWFEENL